MGIAKAANIRKRSPFKGYESVICLVTMMGFEFEKKINVINFGSFTVSTTVKPPKLTNFFHFQIFGFIGNLRFHLLTASLILPHWRVPWVVNLGRFYWTITTITINRSYLFLNLFQVLLSHGRFTNDALQILDVFLLQCDLFGQLFFEHVLIDPGLLLQLIVQPLGCGTDARLLGFFDLLLYAVDTLV